MFKEEWKPVYGYEGLYEVSNCGNIKSLNWYSHKGLEHIITPQLTKKGYLRIVLYKDKKVKSLSMHRIVWEAFNGPIPDDLQINHINEVKTDNRIENLELCTNLYNMRYGTRSQRVKDKLINRADQSKAVACFDREGNQVNIFPSLAEAGRWIGKKDSKMNISSAVRGHRNTAYGYVWKYVD